MNFSKFHKIVQQILKTDLPSSQAIVKAGHAMASDIRIGRTAFMDNMGVESELAYKKKCMCVLLLTTHKMIALANAPIRAPKPFARLEKMPSANNPPKLPPKRPKISRKISSRDLISEAANRSADPVPNMPKIIVSHLAKLSVLLWIKFFFKRR